MNTRIHRLAERARYDRITANAILDAALIAHVGVLVEGAPVVLPFVCARLGEELLLHGSTKAGILGAIAVGASICATVTHVDGIVVARSGFNSSLNYRSVVIAGRARVISDVAEKRSALNAIVEKLMPGQRSKLRDHTPGELDATVVVALPIQTFSSKVRVGGPKDPADDIDATRWAGVVPLRTAFGPAEPAGDVGPTAPLPAFINAQVQR